MNDAIGFEARAIAEAVAQVSRRELEPRALALDSGDPGAFEHCWSEICGLGLERALAGGQQHGFDLEPRQLLVSVEQLASAEAGIALCVLLNNLALAIAVPSHPDVLLDGGRVSLVPAALGPANALEPFRIEAHAGHVTISGSHRCALATADADAIVVEIASGDGPVMVLVPIDAEGLTSFRDENQMGLRSAAAARLELDRVQCTVCEAGPGTLAPGAARALLRLGVAAIARGVAVRARKLALEYAEVRRQGGVPILQHGAVREMLGSMAVRLGCPIPGEPDLTVALKAKAAETDAAVETTRDAVQIMGGVGYMRESGMEKLMRDAKYCQLYPEPGWVLRNILAGM